jgi:phage-related protein
MATQTFTWRVERAPAPTINYRTIEAQFGDGFKQVSADGINTKDESFDITTNGTDAVIQAIVDFFDAHNGTKSFLWKPPFGKLSLFTCKTFKAVPQGPNINVLTATFVKSFSSGVP